jgi:hypothetical protein
MMLGHDTPSVFTRQDGGPDRAMTRPSGGALAGVLR